MSDHEYARARWQALGTSAELLLGDAGDLAQARSIVERELAAIDRACSRFRDDSDLTRVNKHAGRTVVVDPLLIEATELALRAAELTEGDVDPTIGAALELAGYDRDWRLLERSTSDRSGGAGAVRPVQSRARCVCSGSQARRASRVLATVRPGWHTVEVDRERRTLRVPLGVKLDLGATAKAWAADRAVRAVHDETYCSALVSLGGDIATAGQSPVGGWQVHVTDDHRSGPGAPGQRISISSGGLATSSTTVRRWLEADREMHHILDPATGEPVASRWRTVSVAAIDCADANIAATAAIVRGERACRWLADLGLPARLVAWDDTVKTVGSWPKQEPS